MKISIYHDQNPNIKWRSWTVKNAGLGGTYVLIYNLAKGLVANGHEVTIWGHILKEDIYDGINFIDVSRYNKNYNEDVLIGCESFPIETSAKRKINWVHRNVDKGIYDQKFDVAVFASNFHKDIFKTEGRIIPNMVDLELFDKNVKKFPNDIHYVGHPIKAFRYFEELSMRLMEKMKPHIDSLLAEIGSSTLKREEREKKKEKSKLMIHLWGDAEIWGWDREKFNDLQTKLIKAKVLYHGRSGQVNIARALNLGRIFLNPSVFEEPFGLAILEGMAAGCVPVSSSVGNIPELIKDCGTVVDGLPDDFGWLTKATDATVDLLCDESKFRHKSKLCKERAREFSISKITSLWEALIKKI